MGTGLADEMHVIPTDTFKLNKHMSSLPWPYFKGPTPDALAGQWRTEDSPC